jgi:hypothetical protein
MHGVGDNLARYSDGVSHELPGYPIGDVSPEPQAGEAVMALRRSRQSPELSRLAEGTAHNPTEWVNHSARVMSSFPSTSVHRLADARVAAFGHLYVAKTSRETFGDVLPHYSA